jgi:hypothetical protein
MQLPESEMQIYGQGLYVNYAILRYFFKGENRNFYAGIALVCKAMNHLESLSEKYTLLA